MDIEPGYKEARFRETNQPLPHDLALEKTVLGMSMLDKIALSMMIEKLEVVDFYATRHADLFQIIKKMVESKISVDLVSVNAHIDMVMKDELKSLLDDVADKVCAMENYESHLTLMTNISMRRKLISAAYEIIRMSYFSSSVEDISSDDIAEKSEGLIRDATCRVVKENESTMPDVLSSVFARMERRHLGDGAIKTGYTAIDQIVQIEEGDLIIMAGRPGMGKTAIITCLSKSLAKMKTPIGFFSLEMSKVQLGQRMLSDEAEVSLFTMINSALPKRDYPKLSMVASTLADLPIVIDDTPLLTLGVFRSKVRKMISKYNIKGVVIDYLQLMGKDEKMDTNGALEKLTRGLKLTAAEFGIFIIALSQLSRENEKRGGKKVRPQLSDLRGSGSIEQDANTVMFIHRHHQYDADHPKEDAEIIVAKQRNGPTGVVHLEYKPECAGFRDIKRDETESGF
jgi:replicative DNA helicase